MSKNSKTLPVFSSDFVRVTKEAVDAWLELNDVGENCVPATELAEEKCFKLFREADGSKIHPKRLTLMIMSVVSTGQVPGLSIRKGRHGGIFRTKASRAVVSKKPVVNTTVVPANDQAKVAATGTGE